MNPAKVIQPNFEKIDKSGNILVKLGIAVIAIAGIFVISKRLK